MLSSLGVSTEPVTKNGTVIVIGSGPAGAAAIWQLTRAGVNVTLLDAGLANTALGFTARIGGVTVARVHRTLEARVADVTVTGDPSTILYEDMAPGGLTNHWSCAVPRFSHDDFLDARRAGVAYEWPVGYDDLAPWYDQVEPLLCISGSPTGVPQLPGGKVRDVRELDASWRPMAAAAVEDGQAILPVPYTYGAGTTFTMSGTVFNSYVRVVKPVRRTGRLTIRHGLRVTQLEWSGANKRVQAVIGIDQRTKREVRIPCRAVVLAAGTVNTTKILLQSTSQDFPAGLGNTHGVLGRYLHDHPLGKMEIELGRPVAFQPAAYVTRQPLDRTTPLYAAACLQWSGVRPLVRSVMQGHPGRSTECGFNVFGTMAPSLDNFVALDTSRKSSDGTPALTMNIHHPAESAKTLEATRDQLTHLLDRAGLRPRTRLWLIDSVGSAIHFAGTCRMHASPRYGMLDAWSRMHGVPNLVVADSAAFTTGPEKNPALTAMALAARASARLAEDLRTSTI